MTRSSALQPGVDERTRQLGRPSLGLLSDAEQFLRLAHHLSGLNGVGADLFAHELANTAAEQLADPRPQITVGPISPRQGAPESLPLLVPILVGSDCQIVFEAVPCPILHAASVRDGRRWSEYWRVRDVTAFPETAASSGGAVGTEPGRVRSTPRWWVL